MKVFLVVEPPLSCTNGTLPLKNLSYIHLSIRMLRIFRNNHLALLSLTAILTACHPAVGHAQAGNPAVAHLQYALIGNFKLENGRSIDQCKIAYQTFGNLN